MSEVEVQVVERTAVEVVQEPTAVIEVQIAPVTVIEVMTGAPGPQGPAGVDFQEYVDDHMLAHVMDPSPHPAYDNMADLVLVFENGLI